MKVDFYFADFTNQIRKFYKLLIGFQNMKIKILKIMELYNKCPYSRCARNKQCTLYCPQVHKCNTHNEWKSCEIYKNKKRCLAES